MLQSTGCNDGQFCNTDEACDGAGTCSGGAPNPCSDNDPCTEDQCNEGAGECENPCAAPACGDGKFCACAETCDPSAGDPPDDGCAAPQRCNASCDACVDAGACDGSAASPTCVDASICTAAATNDACRDDAPGDCRHNACIGVVTTTGGEFQICSDNSNQGVGQPCESSSCSDDDEDDTSAVGADCCKSRGRVTVNYVFNTQSRLDTPFMLWMRVRRDDDTENDNADERYTCGVTGVNNGGRVDFTYTRNGLRDGAYGPGPQGQNEDYGWAAANNWSASAFDPGAHTLSCTINTDSYSEIAGFDGYLFTTNLSYVPDEADEACNDDGSFTAGSCFGNWGPNWFDPGDVTPGHCSDGEFDAAGTLCDGAGCPGTGSCSASGYCVCP